MSVLSLQEPTAVASRRRFRPNRVAILMLGAIVVPFALMAALNSYGALTEESAVRMAFATVAGQTVAVVSGFAVVAITVMRRMGAVQIALSVIVSLIILASALAIVSSAGDTLLQRLELVSQTNLLN